MIVAQAGALRDLLESDGSSDGEISDAAAALRDLLRPYV
jgi:hypothetical protein